MCLTMHKRIRLRSKKDCCDYAVCKRYVGPCEEDRVFLVLVRLSEPYLHRDIAFPWHMVVLVQIVREMVAFALLSTGCCFQAMVLYSPFPCCSIRPNRMSCHHPSCLWYIMNQVQFLLGFLALCKASDGDKEGHKDSEEPSTYFSTILTFFAAAARSYPAALQLPSSISPTL